MRPFRYLFPWGYRVAALLVAAPRTPSSPLCDDAKTFSKVKQSNVKLE